MLEEALLPAELALVQMGEQARVREARMFLQVATRDRFVQAFEAIVGRSIVSFESAMDPDRNVVYEISHFAPLDGAP